jgi:hypothetical protein
MERDRMSWFEILKQDNITHFHGTNKKGIAEAIMESGIIPQLDYKAYKNGKRVVLAKHPVRNEETGKIEEISELAGKYSWASKEAPLGYSGWFEEREATLEPTFDKKGKFISMAGKPKQFEWKEGGMFGIKGKDIEWLEVYSACYRMNIPHYVTKEIIPPSKLIWMPIDDWKKWYKNHNPKVWADCEQEIMGRGKLLDEENYNYVRDRDNWGLFNR